MIRQMRAENGGALRALTGQGEPGMATLLGGTSPEEDSNGLRTYGGPGQVSGVSRRATVDRDTHLRAVASGTSSGGTGWGSWTGDPGTDQRIAHVVDVMR